MPSNRIRELRKARGLSGHKLAQRLGTSVQQLYRLEMGERRLTLEWMQRIAAALECNEYELLGESKPFDLTTLVVGQLQDEEHVTPVKPPKSIAGPVAGVSLAAIEVPATTAQARFNPGDILFYRQQSGDWDDSCLNRECVVALTDGTLQLKVVLERLTGAKRRICAFGSYNSKVVELSWASPILWVKKSLGGVHQK